MLEYVEQSAGWYGTPLESINGALDKRGVSVIFTDVEVGSGWPSIEQYVTTLPLAVRPKLLKVFMLPEMSAKSYFNHRLPKELPNDFEGRGLRSAWEIFTAPQPEKAQIILTNPIQERKEDGTKVMNIMAPLLVHHMQKFLANPLSLRS